jgi:hypothetical protein
MTIKMTNLLLPLLLVTGAASGQGPDIRLHKATFASGCFWATSSSARALSFTTGIAAKNLAFQPTTRGSRPARYGGTLWTSSISGAAAEL